MEENQKKPEERLEFLKREEIVTMQKDVASLRETEAQKEKERIGAITPGEKIPEASKFPAGQVKTLIPKFPKKPSPFQKVLIRIIAVSVLFLFVGFFYWYFAIRPEKPPEEVISPRGEETPSTTATTTATTTSETPEISETEVSAPPITEKIVTWGFYIPTATRTIDTIIILSTIGPGKDPYSLDGVIQESKRYRLSPHYLITREGIIYRLVPDEYVAYQAGAGQMPDGSRKDVINNFSIGIELIYAQTESPNDAQFKSLAELVAYLKQKYNIPSANILGHKDISSSGKTDPWNFDWVKFDETLK